MLAQLASRASTVLRLGASSGEDPLVKIVNMVEKNIETLENEASKDAKQKAFCDKATATANEKKDEKQSTIEKLSSKLEQMSSHSAELKEEVSALQQSLAELATAQGDMDKLRQKEHANFLKRSPEMQQGIEGVQMALKVIKEYYSKSDKADAANGIVGMMEVVESDFSKSLAEMKVAEQSAQSAYEQETQENKLEKATKEKDVEYKTKERTSLEKASAEMSSDRQGVQTELDAVFDALKSLDEQCIAKPEPYEERKKRREEELEGLKESLEALKSKVSPDAALIQLSRSSMRRQGRQHQKLHS
jgi:chromosome segregation ATPase